MAHGVCHTFATTQGCDGRKAVSRIGTWPPACLEPAALFGRAHQRLAHQRLPIPLHQPGPALAEYPIVKSQVFALSMPSIFAGNSGPHGRCRLPVRESVDTLHHRDQRQSPGRFGCLSTARIAGDTQFLLNDRAQFLTSPEAHVPFRADDVCKTGSCFGPWGDWFGFERHPGLLCSAEAHSLASAYLLSFSSPS
jgi:hypothetical protein